MRTKGLLIAGLVAIVVGIVGLITTSVLFAAPTGIGSGFPIPSEALANPNAANGAHIYFTATDSFGRPIPYRGGMMMRMACANCHGSNGHGLRTMMFVSPNITYANLTNPEGMVDVDGRRVPPYDDNTIKRAITQGINSEGEPLAWPMPQWQMSEGDLDDLIAFLKTLK